MSRFNKALFISRRNISGSLTLSLISAVKKQVKSVESIEVNKLVTPSFPIKSIGQKIHHYLDVETWTKQANRKLAIEIKNSKPDVIFLIGKTQVELGTLAYVRSILPKTRVVLIWMDTLCNLEKYTINYAPFVDLVASYSSTSIPIFNAIGYQNVQWIPLAGDVEMHGINNQPASFDYDLSFIGGWRPEREAVLIDIVKQFPSLKVKILGTDWERKSSKSSPLQGKYENRAVRGSAYAEFLNKSRINLNQIDDTNFPSANMRFFEVPMAFGLQLSSHCPEQENIFINGQHVLYYESQEEMFNQIQYALDNENEMTEVRKNAHQLIIDGHTYDHRVTAILKHLNEM